MDSRFSTPSSNMSFILASTLIISFIAATNAATFQITNQCSYTVWAAASPGGGRELNSGQSWEINVAPGTAGARIWGRTGCQFDSNGNGHCETGDCGGVLECSGYGQAPNTLAEYALKQSYGLDYFDISVVAGYNVPLEFGPTTGTSNTCRDITCTGVTAQCPAKLQAPGGCNNPCTVFNTNEYCCTDGQGSCGPTTYSEYFKGKCPDAYSYPQDTENTVYTCPSGTNYKVVFCP